MRGATAYAGDDLISPEALSDLVGAIYDCVLDPTRWPDALSAIRHELSCHDAVLALQALPSNQVLLHVSEGIAPEWIERMVTYGPDVVDIWGGPGAYGSLPLLEPLVLSQVSAEHFTRNRYYLEWMQPQGLVDAIGIGLSRDANSVGSFGLGRHESSGRIGARDLEVARLLIPHLHRAVVITRLLDARRLIAETLETALDSIGTPIVLVGSDLRIVHANQSAEGLFHEGASLSAEKGRLTLASRAAMAALCAAVERIGRDDETTVGAQGVGIPVPSLREGPGVLHVFPLLQRRNLAAPTQAVAAIFVATRSTPPRAPSQLIRALFGLTDAETRVYESIVTGATVAQTASRFGVEPSTVRSHLLRIFEKTGTHRQSELAALGVSLAAPVPFY